jgi:hypothetical protein
MPIVFLIVVVTIVALFLIAYSFRRSIRKSVRFTTVTCPECGNTPHRIHRTTIIRWLSAIIPLRMFGCLKCKKTFVRVKPLNEQIGAIS